MGSTRGGLKGPAEGGWKGCVDVSVKETSMGSVARAPSKTPGALIYGTVGMDMAKTTTEKACFIVIRVSRGQRGRSISTSPIGIEMNASFSRIS